MKRTVGTAGIGSVDTWILIGQYGGGSRRARGGHVDVVLAFQLARYLDISRDTAERDG